MSLNANTLCIREEREALLKIKKHLQDPFHDPFSWVGEDCCSWTGIGCDQSGHILSFELSFAQHISGEINPSITDLKHLRYLDLSSIDFGGIPIPKFIGSLHMLRYLDLSYSNFSGMIPTHLGNLSNLQYLYISTSFSSLWVKDVSWLFTLSSLRCLHMKGVNIISTSHDLFPAVNMMPSLLELRLISCNLRTFPPSFPFENITSLLVFDLSQNPFNSSTPSWLFNITKLTELYLQSSSLRGPFPVLQRGNLCNLRNMDLSNNYLTGDITQMLDTLSSCRDQSLEHLDLSSNHLIRKLPNFVGKFNHLASLDLSSNSLLGPIPTTIGNLSNLNHLNLEGNMMNGDIPKSIGQLTQLHSLNLLQNNWEGIMTNIHFQNLTNLISFCISSKPNSFAFKVTQDWTHHLNNLFYVEISDCQIGPAFPNWLRNQTCLGTIMLQNLKGSIPLWSGVKGLDLSNKLLSGIIQNNIGEEMSDLEFLDLSNNQLIGIIPQSINKIQNLLYLDLSNNYLTGTIPVFWMGMQGLSIIDLSYNNLSGGIPTSICSLPSLFILELSNNNLSTDFSPTFQNCTSLQTLSLGNNMLFGSIPKEITKNLPSLAELLLRGNALTGSIPNEICGLPSLHLVDLSNKNLSGSIPACLGNVYGFKLPQTSFINSTEPLFIDRYMWYTKHIELIMKGKIIEYMDRMPVHSTIDLSDNSLCGEIPEKLTELIHLGALNLSWSMLTGNIPNNIGSLKDLESLDLSHNHLSGPIPPSMTSMTFLSFMNLSYNNLSGQIPVANQFGTFNDPSIYEGNPQLCGDPLPNNCSSPLSGNVEKGRKHEDDEKIDKLCLYASIIVGYITSFWLVCGSLYLKRSWRHAYFNFVFDMKDKLLFFVVANLRCAKCKFDIERAKTTK
ncbi:hypothetical protein Fmac_010946 [Flemingia macrophylla]|uniref:Leucine-rich repeat-containing N-terminal plant-type domain-containing protein n=1 Tax=Flemingia macrophylla TaxID=520843 RepID=A0ABD1MN48_9FABA